MKYVKRILKLGGWILWVAFLGIILFEVVLRGLNGWFFQAPDCLQHDPEVGSVSIPNFTQTVGIGKHRTTITHNSLGLRSPPIRQDNPELRVLLVGDSYAYGWGTEDSTIVSRQLQRELIHRGYDAEVINLGVAGFSTIQAYLFLKRFTYLDPDVIVYLFCDNDPRDNLAFISTDPAESYKGTSKFFLVSLLRRYSLAINSYFRKQIFLSRQPHRPFLVKNPDPRWLRHERSLVKPPLRELTVTYTDSMAFIADSVGAIFQIAFIGIIEDTAEVDRSITAQTYRRLFKERGHYTVPPPEGLYPYINDPEPIYGDVPFIEHFNHIYYGLYAQELARSIIPELENLNQSESPSAD
jgi:hypothetical protein